MLYQQVLQNKRKTVWLITLFSILVLAIGWAIGYFFSEAPYTGLIITLIIVAIYVPMTYATANSQVLNMAGAKKSNKKIIHNYSMSWKNYRWLHEYQCLMSIL